MVRLLGIVALAFNAWMLVDAYRRRAENYWLWIIVGVPGGSLAYFFMVKLKDRQMQDLGRRLMSSFEKPPPPDELRLRYEESPSFSNRLALAQGLADNQLYAEAKGHFEALLESRADDKDALYGRGVCELEMGDATVAVTTLERLVEMAPGYREFGAWAELAHAYARQGRSDDCLRTLRELVQHSPRLPHQLLLAKQLVAVGSTSEAQALLERALREHERSPRYVRRNNRPWARQAKRLLQSLAETRAA